MSDSHERGLQIAPWKGTYSGGYDFVTKCDECGSTGHCVDQLEGGPCNSCGSIISIGLIGKWIEPTYTGKWWWSTVVNEGYWHIREIK